LLCNLKKAILKAFTQCGTTELNDFLIPLIDCKEASLRIEAVRALGTCGLLSAVELLHELVKQFLLKPELKFAAKESINRIQARCAKGVEAGWLSIPDEKTDNGALSLTDRITDEGALSLDDEEEK
jgi:hypothetical protein